MTRYEKAQQITDRFSREVARLLAIKNAELAQEWEPRFDPPLPKRPSPK